MRICHDLLGSRAVSEQEGAKEAVPVRDAEASGRSGASGVRVLYRCPRRDLCRSIKAVGRRGPQQNVGPRDLQLDFISKSSWIGRRFATAMSCGSKRSALHFDALWIQGSLAAAPSLESKLKDATESWELKEVYRSLQEEQSFMKEFRLQRKRLERNNKMLK